VAEETRGDSGRNVTKEPGTKLCPICKNVLPESAQFCDECGNSLEAQR
jgi:predicted amidophosphoribosyltransferase